MTHLFGLAVRVGDDLRELRVGLRQEVLVVSQVRLVGVVSLSRLKQVGVERAGTLANSSTRGQTYGDPAVM